MELNLFNFNNPRIWITEIVLSHPHWTVRVLYDDAGNGDLFDEPGLVWIEEIDGIIWFQHICLQDDLWKKNQLPQVQTTTLMFIKYQRGALISLSFINTKFITPPTIKNTRINYLLFPSSFESRHSCPRRFAIKLMTDWFFFHFFCVA